MRGLECSGTTMYCGTYVHATRGGAAAGGPQGPRPRPRARAVEPYSLRRVRSPPRPTTHTPALQLHEYPGIGPRRQSSSGHADALCGCHSRKAAAPCRSPGRKASSYRIDGDLLLSPIPWWRCPFYWLKASLAALADDDHSRHACAADSSAAQSCTRPSQRERGGAIREAVCALCARLRGGRACQTRPPMHSCLLSARAAPHSGSVSASRIDHTAISGNLGYSPPRASTTHRTAASARRRGCEAERRNQDSRRLWTAPARRRPRGCHDGCGERGERGAIVQGRVSRKGLACVSEVSRKCRKVSEGGAPVSPVEGEPVALLRLKVSLTERQGQPWCPTEAATAWLLPVSSPARRPGSCRMTQRRPASCLCTAREMSAGRA